MTTEVLPGNGLRSSLAAAITAGATTLQIQSADVSRWPSSGQYRAVLCQDSINGPFELVKVTGGQGTATLTVTRAVESYNGDSTARAWPLGTAIAAVITHDGLDARYLPLTGGTLTGNLTVNGLVYAQGGIAGGSPVTNQVIQADYNDLLLSSLSGKVQLVTGGTPRLSIDSGGSIGIGNTADPARAVYLNKQTTGSIQYGLYLLAQDGVGNGVDIRGVSVGVMNYVSGSAVTQLMGLEVRGPSSTSGSSYGTSVGISVQSPTPPTIGCATAITLQLFTPTATSYAAVIDSATGAKLTTAGAWTNAPSWGAQKTAINPVPDSQLSDWLDWLADDLEPVRYRHPEILNDQGEVILYTPADAYDHFGFLLDDVPQDLREVVCYDASGALSTKDTEGFVLGMLKAAGQRIKALEARVAALEATP